MTEVSRVPPCSYVLLTLLLPVRLHRYVPCIRCINVGLTTIAYCFPDFGRFPAYVCTAAETEAFELQVLQYMYNNPQVERYAAFGAFLDWAAEGNSNALVTTDGRISELGRLYATTT